MKRYILLLACLMIMFSQAQDIENLVIHQLEVPDVGIVNSVYISGDNERFVRLSYEENLTYFNYFLSTSKSGYGAIGFGLGMSKKDAENKIAELRDYMLNGEFGSVHKIKNTRTTFVEMKIVSRERLEFYDHKILMGFLELRHLDNTIAWLNHL